MKNFSRSILVAFGATLAASTALADDAEIASSEGQAQIEEAQTASDASPQNSNSLQVVRDKETGKLRAATAKEQRELAKMEQEARKTNKSAPAAAASDPVITRSANGMTRAKLGSEHLMSLHGERSEDGTIKKSHAEQNDDQPTDNENPTE